MYRRIRLALKTASLGVGITDKGILFAWCMYVYIQSICKMPVFWITPLIRFTDASFNVKLGTLSDFWVLKDVLIDREYDCVSLQEADYILDLGCNIGLSTLFLAAKFPNAHIWAVEPNPVLLPQLLLNTAQAKNVKIETWALGKEDGTATMRVDSNTSSSSILATDTSKTEITVRTVCPNSIRKTLNIPRIDLIKFDIEGAELFLFENFAEFDKVGAYVGEVHYDLAGFPKKNISEYLHQYRYSEQYIKKSRSILYAEHK